MTDYPSEMVRLSGLLDDALSYMRRQTVELANAEEAYRQEKAAAWLRVERESTTAAEREALVNGTTAGARKARDLAEGMRQAALEAVRSRRTQISAMQSLLNADRAEAEIANYGPDVPPRPPLPESSASEADRSGGDDGSEQASTSSPPDTSWRQVMEAAQVDPVDLMARLVKRWPSNDKAAAPKRTKDLDVAAEREPDLVMACIGELEDEKRGAA